MTKKINNILLISIALIIIFGLADSPMQAQNRGKKAKTEKTTAVQDNWQTISSKEIGFSILFPGVAEEIKTQAEYRDGTTDPMTVWLFRANEGNATFSLSYSPMSSEVEPNTFFRGMLDEAGRSGELIKSSAISLNGHPGRDFLVLSPNLDF